MLGCADLIHHSLWNYFHIQPEFKEVLPASVCTCWRLKSIPSCKHSGWQAVPLNQARLFQDISSSGIGKSSKQLQHNRKKQGVYHNQNVLPKCSTTLLTSPPALLIIHYSQENSPKYNFVCLFFAWVLLQNTTVLPLLNGFPNYWRTKQTRHV